MEDKRFFFFLIDKLHKYIDQKSIQEVYKAKAEKTAKAKGKKHQTIALLVT